MKSGRLIATTVAIWVGLSGAANAALHIEVTQGNLQPLPIAIPDFVGSGSAPGANIASVVRADLDRSGLFKPLDTKSFLDQIQNIDVPPNFANWRVINAQALVTAQQSTQPDGQLCVAF